MNDEKYVIGVDFGTLSARAVLVDTANGAELSSATAEYKHGVMDEVLYVNGAKLSDSYALQDPDDYVDALVSVVRKVVKDSNVDKNDIVGLGIDFTSCTVLPVDKDFVPLCKKAELGQNPHAWVKLWKHHGAQKYADKMTEVAREKNQEFLPRLGNMVSSESALPKLWETMQEAPIVYEATEYFLEAGDWLSYLLTGECTRSYLFSAFKNAYIDGKGYPDKEYLRALDERLESVMETKFRGKITYMGESVGKLRKEFSEKLGLTENTVIATPLIDAHAAAPAVGIKDEGDMVAVIGTSACFLTISEKDVVVTGISGVVKDGLIPDFFGYEAGLCCVGDHFAYASQNLTSAEYVKEAEERGISMIELLTEKASKKQVGESGLIALNWWNGNRSLLGDSTLRGLFVGMNLTTKPEDYMRALMEATAFGVKNIVDNYKKHGVDIKKIIATGGIARKNAFLMQMYADVLGIEIKVAQNPQAPATGSAINSAVASGVYPDFKSAIEHMACGVDAVYYPREKEGEIYNELYAEYVKLHDYFGRGQNNVMKKLGEISSRVK